MGRGFRGVRARALTAAACVALEGCGDEPTAQAPCAEAGCDAGCPVGWVPTARGGCGPAVLLCGAGGGAAEGACARADLARPAPLEGVDGGLAGFRLLADGGVGGAWPEPGAASVGGDAPCPRGWRRDADGVCLPEQRADCPAGSGALPGGGCTPTAESDCPAGEYAEPPAGAASRRVVRVRAGAAGPADGSVAAPFATIGEAVARVGDGGVVLVARGVYRERLRITSSVEVVGVCAARVVLDGTGVSSAGPVAVNVLGEGVDVGFRGLTIRGQQAGLRAHFGARVRVSRVVVSGCLHPALYAYERGSVLEVTSSLVRDVRESSPNSGGSGLAAYDEASVQADEVVVERASGAAVAARTGGRVTLRRGAVRDTQRASEGDSFGLLATERATVEASETVVERGLSAAASSQGEGATIALTDVLLRGGDGAGGLAVGRGLHAGGGGLVRGARVWVDGAREGGVLVQRAGSRVTLAGAVVRGTIASPQGAGHGFAVSAGGALVAEGALVTGNTSQGVVAYGEGTSVQLDGCVVRDTRARPRMHDGAGLLVAAGASLRARGVLVEGNVSFGMIAHGQGSEATLEGVAVRRTRRDAWGYVGRGVAVSAGATLSAAGLLVADSFEEGLSATGTGTTLRARDVAVLEVRPSDAGLGRAVLIDGASTTLARLAVQGAAGAAVLVSNSNGAGVPTTIHDLFVRDTRASTVNYVTDGETNRPSGSTVAYGLHTTFGGEVRVTRAVIDGGGYGLFNAAGVLSLRDGVIARQRDALGAYSPGTAPEATTLRDVRSVDNVVPTLVRREGLPAAATLGAPRDPCDDGCL